MLLLPALVVLGGMDPVRANARKVLLVAMFTVPPLAMYAFAGLVERIAVGLAALGVEKNDVVSCQLPNWWQFTALAFACWRIGAVINPMMPIFREREVTFMLGFAESKLFVVPREYRGFDYAAMAQGVRSDLPKLERVLVVDGQGEDRQWF